MTSDPIKRIAVVGGGTAGWIAASALARRVGKRCSIHLIESPDIPTVGVGEATIPGILDFVKFLGVEQSDFMDHTQSTIKLGIRFVDWLKQNHEYWHPFGPFGVSIDRLPFFHFWQKARELGVDAPFRDFNLEIALAEQNKFIYTTATARPAGWQWRIPLQHRLGTGYVYSSQHVSDDDALNDLLAVPGNAEPLTEPRFIRFVTGRRKVFWNKNVIALGLASGFIEPLESTSIHLIYSGVYNLLDHFPDRGFEPVNTAHYNAQMTEEYERVRDFIILHYCTTQRDDTDYWRACRERAIPEDLAARLDLYRRTGRIFPRQHEVFTDLSWFFVMEGMDIRSISYNPLVDTADWNKVLQVMAGIRQKVASDVAQCPSHDSFFVNARTDVAPAKGWVRREQS